MSLNGCGEREDAVGSRSELREKWLRHTLEPPPTHVPVTNGRPIGIGKRKRSQMRYRTRVRRGLTKSISGEVVRDARMTLLAASWRSYERQKAAHALLMGRFIQHQIREDSSFVDCHEVTADRQVQAETILANPNLQGTSQLADNYDDDISDDDDNYNNNKGYETNTDNESGISDGLFSCTSKDNIAHSQFSKIANGTCLSGTLALINASFPLSNKDVGQISTNEEKYNDWERRAFSAVRELDVAQEVNINVLKSVATRVAQLATSLASERAHEPVCAGFPGGPSEGARRVAVYRSFGVRWTLRMLDDEFDKNKTSVCDIDEEKCIEKYAEWVGARFADNARLAEMSLHRGALQSVRAPWVKCLLQQARESQVRALLRAMHSPRKDIAKGLITMFGSARRAVRARLDDTSVITASLHGPFGTFQRIAANRPFIARFLKDTFQSLSFTHVSHFGMFAYPRNADHADDILRTTPDERLEAYLCVARNLLESTPDDGNAFANFDASWRLFCRVCSDTRVNDCMTVTTNLLDAEKRGTAVLARLARETFAQTFRRCSDLDQDGALALKRFAQGYVESSPNLYKINS